MVETKGIAKANIDKLHSDCDRFCCDIVIHERADLKEITLEGLTDVETIEPPVRHDAARLLKEFPLARMFIKDELQWRPFVARRDDAVSA